MWRVLLTSFLTSFVLGGLGIAIPLVLLERNVGLAEIGLIMSILPLVFLFVRILFAALADQVGWSPLFVVNWLALSLASIIYLVAGSPLDFALGKVMEGVSISAYWAVSRTATYILSPSREAGEATRVIGVVTLGGAVGGAVTGFVMSISGAWSAFVLLTAASMMLLYPTVLLWSEGRRKAKLNLLQALKALDFRGKSRDFWAVSGIMAINSLARYPLTSLVLPVFMSKELGYSYMVIGGIFMVYNIVTAITVFGTMKMPLSLTRAVIQSMIYVVACVCMTFSSETLLPVFIVALAVASGLGTRFYESIIAKVSKDRRETLSIDIGILHIPLRTIEFSSLILFSLLMEKYGYLITFILSGVAYVAFSILSYIQISKR
ncbi:MAG: MFS transporter [archaeon GB-1867-005]|nr:MFS transporter [Candidatus Culexmicrobium cathedralense]